jgi:antitoxin ParD1/3/4
MIKYAFSTQDNPMSDLERLTITMSTDLASLVKAAVAGGDYASTSEVIREALRDWKLKRTIQQERIAALKADIADGLRSGSAGKLDIEDIKRRGRERLSTVKRRSRT